MNTETIKTDRNGQKQTESLKTQKGTGTNRIEQKHTGRKGGSNQRRPF